MIEGVGGPEVPSPAGAVEIDGTGKFVSPGIIDIHSHLGDYASPGVDANSDGNEATDPVHPDVWAEHSVWPQDPGFSRALVNGGVTTLQILPGSADLFGGRSVVLKNVPGRTVQEMKFPGAPYGLKMACGENPEAGLRIKGHDASDAHGQHRARPRDLDEGCRLQEEVGRLLRQGRRHARARCVDGYAEGRP